MKLHLYFLLLMALGNNLIAQSATTTTGTLITGQILDDVTAEPLVGATVRLVGKTGGTMTDINGKFSIYTEKEDLISIHYFGYESLELLPEEVSQNLNNMVQMYANTRLALVEIVGQRVPLVDLGSTIVCGGGMRFITLENTPNLTGALAVAPAFSLTYFPNPTTESITINTDQQGGIVELYSTRGDLLKTQTVTDYNTYISMTDLPSGIYYLNYRLNGFTSVTHEVVLAH
jgi:CarboxypepD_reg-like domain/Secretion system C-terminal sorting domain